MQDFKIGDYALCICSTPTYSYVPELGKVYKVLEIHNINGYNNWFVLNYTANGQSNMSFRKEDFINLGNSKTISNLERLVWGIDA